MKDDTDHVRESRCLNLNAVSGGCHPDPYTHLLLPIAVGPTGLNSIARSAGPGLKGISGAGCKSAIPGTTQASIFFQGGRVLSGRKSPLFWIPGPADRAIEFLRLWRFRNVYKGQGVTTG